jgi:transcriptional regulator with XRE-family HTH domain
VGTPEPETTDLPFAEAFAALKRASGKSFRQLASELEELDGHGLSASFLSALTKGTQRPGPRTMANVARVLGKDRTYFAEYRLAQMRALFDEGGESGLPGALGAVEAIEQILGDRARSVDPTQYPHASPIGAGPGWRPTGPRAAA